MKKQQNEKFLTLKDFLDTIKDLRESLASKKDLEELATKKDLEYVRESLLQAIEGTDEFARNKLNNHEKRITVLEQAKN